MIKTALFCAGLAMAVLSAGAQAGGDPDRGKGKTATCTACHGEDGNSPITANPRLAGQHASYLQRALMDYKSGARQNPVMAGFASTLSDQDIADIAAYYSSQSGLSTPEP